MIRLLKKTSLFSLLVAGISSLSVAQPTLVEKAEARPDGLTIPYEKYKLPNGLTIIVHEDHSDPIVSVLVTYKVGSSRESIGRSGFAHFFEHMMFQGSKHLADEEHIKIVSEAGADYNGETQRDKTIYYETLPANYLETALWLESDRMGFLLDSLTSKKFEVQRDAVKNEKGQRISNQPYTLGVSELVYQNLYPFKHPYSWPGIGYVDDLNRATLQDVKNFFMRWYGPNNAILTVSGDVETKEVLRLAEKYFGPLKPCPEVKKMKVPLPTLPSDKYVSYKDNIYFPLNYRIYPTVPQYHRDEAALDLMGIMMGEGNNSLFYKNFVKNKVAVQAQAGHSCSELAGEFQVEVLTYPPDDYNFEKMFNDIDAKVKSTFDEFEKTGVTDEALQRAKTKTESAIIDQATSVFGKAKVLADWDRLVGRPFNLSDELDRYNKVSKEDIMRVFNKYIKGAGASTLNVYPKLMSKDSVKSVNPYAGMEVKDDPEYTGLKYNPPVDNFDRSKKPAATAAKAPKVPEYYTQQLKNGLKIIGTQTSEIPKVVLYLNIEGGDLVLGQDLKKLGISELTGLVMNEGTKNYSTEQISAELEKLGSNITFSGSKENTSIRISCLKKNLDATLKLLEEKLLNPGFNAEDFKRTKKQYQESIKDQKTNPTTIASLAFSKVLYGNTVWGVSPSVKSTDGIETEDVKSYYEKYYSPSVSTLVISGDVDEKEIMPKLEFLNKWAPKEVKIPAIAAIAPPAETQIYMINRDFAPQSVMAAGQVSLPYDATGEYFKNTIANYPFGGASLTGRLNLDLREEKGYTYGIDSYFSGNKYTGSFVVGASLKRATTGAAIDEMIKDMKNYVEKGVKDEELSYTKNSLFNGDALKYETLFQKASFLYKIATYGLSKDFTQQQSQILMNMSKDDFNKQIKKAMNPDKLSIVIVGDKDIVKKQLEKYNLTKIKNITLD